METEAGAERWSRGHAVALLVSVAAALIWSLEWLPALVGAGSLGVLTARSRGRYTPGARFGYANTLTALRLALIVLLALFCREPPGPREALLALAIFALDGLDGWVARKRGEVSEFGARFDMECDALFVQLCGLALYLHGRVPGYVLLPGSLRYLYVLVLAARPHAAARTPRSRLGRYAFSLFCLSASASLWPLEPIQRPLALVASLVLVVSFARSLYAVVCDQRDRGDRPS